MFNPLERGTGLAPPEAAEQPVRDPDDLCADAALPVPAALDRLDGVAEDPALPVELEDEQAGEVPAALLLLPLAGPARLLGVAVVTAGRAARAPAHDELLGHGTGAQRRLAGDGLARDARREDRELDVADDGDAVPGDRRRPQSRGVGNATGDGREVRVRRGEEVEGDVGGEQVLLEGGLEEGRKAVLEDAEG